MKTTWQRQEEQRAEKLADIREQVAQGTLRIRQMTAKERAENPPRSETPRRGARRTPGRVRKPAQVDGDPAESPQADGSPAQASAG